MSHRRSWTQAELDVLIPKVEQRLAAMEEEWGQEVRGLGPMTPGECLDYLNRLLDHAVERPLTHQECFLHGQLMACYEMAVRAEMLGKKGRYFVVSEEQINRAAAADGGSDA